MKIENFLATNKPNALANPNCDADLKTRLDWALAYAKRGLAVFPLYSIRDGHCTCRRDCGKNAGKHPAVTGGFKVATTDARQIVAWWSKWPDANVGIATGAVSGLVVVDIDGINGLAFLKNFC